MTRSELDLAIGVATRYATHLHKDDRVSKGDAIRAAVGAVVREAQAGGSGLGEPYGDGPAKSVPSFVPAVLVGVGAALLAGGKLTEGMLASGAGWVIQILRT